MGLYKKIFSFSKNQALSSLKNSKLKAKISGLKLLQVPENKTPEFNENSEIKNQELLGKILIIIPAKTGKAHDRNKIRRQIKDIFYKEKLYLNSKISILIVYSQALKLSYLELKEFLTKNIN